MNNECPAVFDDQYTSFVGAIIRSQTHYFDDTVRQIIETSIIPRGEPFTVGDYGSHDGSSSKDILEHLLGSLKQHHGEDLPAHIIYEDTANNDFNALVKKVFCNWRESLNHQKVFLSMCPTSFYEQCVPDNTFHVLLSFWSVHFLPSSVSYKDSLNTFPDGSRAECDAMAALACDGWQRFLLIRAKEIKSGGCMLLIVPAQDTDMKYGESRVHLQNLWVAMTTVWRLLRDLHQVTECEYEAANYPGYYRNEEELRAPFRDDASPVVKAGLRIKSLTLTHEKVHILTQRCKDKEQETEDKDDLESSVSKFVSAIRSWTEYMFMQALSSRSPDSRRDVVNTFYDLLVEHIKQQDISTCGWDNVIGYVVITKK
ncbi:farnesoic acid carboxyl-O-methyltransferase-like [Haliotis rufescens]|uniref:farnesoic acid carboxyl-O-methyltransferase-like n=1 Tax=Haliotis rufescens TaxID=6454 RepID=UPI00201ED8CF|nr:farnesoic acid carboxyl-O-methyltransferase-like [Haliotis rufescens]